MTKDLTLKEKEFAEAFAKLYKTGIDMAQSDIKCLSTMIKFNEERVKNHYDSEPFKFFKKKHEKWEEELNFVSLHDTLKEKNLIDSVEEKLDSLIRKQVDFAYDYDTYNFKDAYESYEDAYFETYDFLGEEQGVTNFIKINKSIMDNIEEDIDNPEMKKLYDRGLALNEELRSYRKEMFRNLENDEIEM